MKHAKPTCILMILFLNATIISGFGETQSKDSLSTISSGFAVATFDAKLEPLPKNPKDIVPPDINMSGTGLLAVMRLPADPKGNNSGNIVVPYKVMKWIRPLHLKRKRASISSGRVVRMLPRTIVPQRQVSSLMDEWAILMEVKDKQGSLHSTRCWSLRYTKDAGAVVSREKAGFSYMQSLVGEDSINKFSKLLAKQDTPISLLFLDKGISLINPDTDDADRFAILEALLHVVQKPALPHYVRSFAINRIGAGGLAMVLDEKYEQKKSLLMVDQSVSAWELGLKSNWPKTMLDNIQLLIESNLPKARIPDGILKRVTKVVDQHEKKYPKDEKFLRKLLQLVEKRKQEIQNTE